MTASIGESLCAEWANEPSDAVSVPAAPAIFLNIRPDEQASRADDS
jgi:hypothetical protein